MMPAQRNSTSYAAATTRVNAERKYRNFNLTRDTLVVQGRGVDEVIVLDRARHHEHLGVADAELVVLPIEGKEREVEWWHGRDDFG
jgi:hypothetical protein